MANSIKLKQGTGIAITGDPLTGEVTFSASSGGASLPAQTGNVGKVLKTDGTNPSWGSLATADITGLSTALASKANTADVTTALADKISAADAPELIADAIGSSVIAGDGISTDYDDAAGTTTVAVAIPDWRARTVTAVTGAAPRLGLTVTVAYNDATSAWPSIDGGLLADPNVAIHWLGGPASATPPASAGPGVWYQQVS